MVGKSSGRLLQYFGAATVKSTTCTDSFDKYNRSSTNKSKLKIHVVIYKIYNIYYIYTYI